MAGRGARRRGWYSRRVDAKALETEALSAIAGALDASALDEARVRYLGRKSELKQALRAVRDRESGQALNATREAIEQAVHEREALLEPGRARPQPHRGERRRHAARKARTARTPAPDHPDPARGRGHLPRARLPGRRRPRGRDHALQLRRAQHAREPSDSVCRCTRSSSTATSSSAPRPRRRRSARWRSANRRST